MIVSNLIGLVTLSDAGLFAVVLLVSLAIYLVGLVVMAIYQWAVREVRIWKAMDDYRNWTEEGRGSRRW